MSDLQNGIGQMNSGNAMRPLGNARMNVQSSILSTQPNGGQLRGHGLDGQRGGSRCWLALGKSNRMSTLFGWWLRVGQVIGQLLQGDTSRGHRRWINQYIIASW